MYVLSEKLKSLKHKLQDWNKNQFGNVQLRVKQAMESVDAVQDQISSFGYSNDRLAQEQEVHLDLKKTLLFEEEFWKEKSRINWHSYGDRNTAFFDKVTKVRNATKRMTMLKKDGLILDKVDKIEAYVLDFYTSLFASNNVCHDNSIIEQVITPEVSLEDNIMLTNLPSREEVKNTVFSMNANGAPGPDGFGGFFFQNYWDIIGNDVFNVALQFFKSSWLMPNYNSNVVVLIPKCPGVDSISQYRLISLANFKFKIITKVLADRLSIVAPKIISENQ